MFQTDSYQSLSKVNIDFLIFIIEFVINVVPLLDVRLARLPSSRVDPTFPDVNQGEFEIGERVLGKRFLPTTHNINVDLIPFGSMHHLTVFIDSLNRESITWVELCSFLGIHSVGEHVNKIDYGSNRESVEILFVSKLKHFFSMWALFQCEVVML